MKKIIFILQAVTFFLLCSCDSQGFTAMTFDNNIRSEIKIENLNGEVNISLVGKYVELHDAYLSVSEALKSAGYYHGKKVNVNYIDDISSWKCIFISKKY